jgi:hypothetical protein
MFFWLKFNFLWILEQTEPFEYIPKKKILTLATWAETRSMPTWTATHSSALTTTRPTGSGPAGVVVGWRGPTHTQPRPNGPEASVIQARCVRASPRPAQRSYCCRHGTLGGERQESIIVILLSLLVGDWRDRGERHTIKIGTEADRDGSSVTNQNWSERKLYCMKISGPGSLNPDTSVYVHLHLL